MVYRNKDRFDKQGWEKRFVGLSDLPQELEKPNRRTTHLSFDQKLSRDERKMLETIPAGTREEFIASLSYTKLGEKNGKPRLYRGEEDHQRQDRRKSTRSHKV